MTFELIALFLSNGSALADSAWSFHKKLCNGIINFYLFWSSKPPQILIVIIVFFNNDNGYYQNYQVIITLKILFYL